MTIWSLIKFLTFMFLPWIIGKFFKLLSKAAKSQQNSGKSKVVPSIAIPSLWDRIRISILIVATIQYFWISIGGGCPKNFFQEIGVSVDAPVFQMRTLFGDFISREANASVAFSTAVDSLKDSCCASGSPEEFELFRERRWCEKQLFFVSPFSAEKDPLTSSEGLRYQKYQCLFERLKSPTRRSTYLQYGQEAALDCNWCTDETDYSIFVLSMAAMSYCFFLILIGLVSTKKEKRSWRKILVVITVFLAVFESLYYLAPHEVASFDPYADIFSDASDVGLTQKLTILRHLFFGICLLLAILFDNGVSHSILDQISAISKQQDVVQDMISLERLQKSALVANKELRKHYISNFEKIENITKPSTPSTKNSDDPASISKPVNFDILNSILSTNNTPDTSSS